MAEKFSGKFATRHNGLQIFFDLYNPNKSPVGTIVFCHGFKGFKNWGAWKQMAHFFNERNLSLVLFDFSCNGIRSENDMEITDEQKFSENTLGAELKDLKELFIHLQENHRTLGLNIDNIYLMGHSRGASIALLFAAAHEFVDKTILWAPVADLKGMYQKFDQGKWKEQGFIEVPNKRTGQVLKMKYSFWEDLVKNGEQYDVVDAALRLNSDLLLIHGTQDESVASSESAVIYEACIHSVFIEIEGANHTFGTRHPWEEQEPLPTHFVQAINETLAFITP